MDQPLKLPIRPENDSLQAHLAALDQLAARLSTLTSQTRWPARIPLTSKATLSGAVVHTNDIKVHVGDGWWIEMTANEAKEYVERRKTALLEEHARIAERQPAKSQVTAGSGASRHYLPAAISFDPIFHGPIAGPSRTREVESQVESTPRALGGAAPSPATPQPRLDAAKQRTEQESKDGEMSLESVLEEFVEKQKTLAESSGRAPPTGGEDPVLNEEGLPIHEIRETEGGDIIGKPPDPTTSGDQPASSNDAEDYWSEEAVARRAALRRKIFNESPSLSDTESDEDDDSGRRTSWTGKALAPTPPRISSPPLTPSTSAQTPHRESPPPRRPSFNAIPGKSILKPPSARKKSVSFDESVPMPPDSPDPGGRIRTIAGFPIPNTMEDGTMSPRPVPIIPPPKPPSAGGGANKQTDGFAGFRKGFLDKPKPVSVSSSTPSAEPPSAESTNGKGRKPSLFAQRLAEAAVKETPGPSSKADTNSTMKAGVVERSPEPSSSRSAVPLRPSNGSTPHRLEDGDDHFDEDEDEDDEDEDGDEYVLDDALLAREVALEYHRHQAYRTMSHEVDPDLADEDIHAQPPTFEEDEEDAGNVMLALPRVDASGRPLIVNPTPDDVRRFVRVGRLENGNLVLAEGENGWSDDEDEGEGDKDARKDNRERVKRQLLGEEEQPIMPRSAVTPIANKAEVQEVGLPPKIGSTPDEAPAVGGVLERTTNLREVESPKKVSRFKQARMGP